MQIVESVRLVQDSFDASDLALWTTQLLSTATSYDGASAAKDVTAFSRKVADSFMDLVGIDGSLSPSTSDLVAQLIQIPGYNSYFHNILLCCVCLKILKGFGDKFDLLMQVFSTPTAISQISIK